MLPGLRRLEVELVEASPHLQLAHPDVHTTWSVIAKLKNFINITIQSSPNSPLYKSGQTWLWTFSGRILWMQWVLAGRLSFPPGCSPSLLSRQPKNSFHNCPPSSTIVNLLSTIVNHCQPLSTIDSHFQQSSSSHLFSTGMIEPPSSKQ